MTGCRSHRCLECGARYAAFRVGLTFAAIRRELRAEPERKRVTRGTILGRMHEHKRNEWNMWHGPGRCVAAAPERIAA